MKHEFVEHEFGQAEENMGGTEGKMEGNTISWPKEIPWKLTQGEQSWSGKLICRGENSL